MQHLDEGTIHAWLDGAVDASDARRIDAHLAECAACASAVAEARGLMAASSRILSALDVVPPDVIPRTPAGDVPARVGAMRGTSLRGTRNRWLPRAARIAAVVAFVAVGATVAARVFGVRTTPHPLPSYADAGARQGAATSAAVAGVQPAPTPTRDPASAAPTPPAHSTSTSSEQAQQRKRTVESALAEAKHRAAVHQAADANAERMVAASDAMRVAPDSLPRLVSTDQVVTVIGSVVQRRIYEVRPGVRVTLEEVAAPPGDFAEPLEVRRTAPESAPAAAPAIVTPPRPRAPAMAGARAAAADSVVRNSIQWSDSTGTRFTLSGPLPVEELRRIKAVVH